MVEIVIPEMVVIIVAAIWSIGKVVSICSKLHK